MKVVLAYNNKQVQNFVTKITDMRTLDDLEYLLFVTETGEFYRPGLPFHEHTFNSPSPEDGYVGFMEGASHHGTGQRKLTRYNVKDYISIEDHSLESLFFLNKNDFVKYKIKSDASDRFTFKVPAQANVRLPVPADKVESLALCTFVYSSIGRQRFSKDYYAAIDGHQPASKVVNNNLLMDLLRASGTPFKTGPLSSIPGDSDTAIMAEDLYGSIQTISPLKISKMPDFNSIGGIFSINIKNLLRKHTNYDSLVENESLLREYLLFSDSMRIRIGVERVPQTGGGILVSESIFNGNEEGLSDLSGNGNKLVHIDLDNNPHHTKSFYFIDSRVSYDGIGPEEKWRYKIKLTIPNRFEEYLNKKVEEADKYVLLLNQVLEHIQESGAYRDKLQIIGNEMIKDLESELSLNQIINFIKGVIIKILPIRDSRLNFINVMNSYTILGIDDLQKMANILVNISKYLGTFKLKKDRSVINEKNERNYVDNNNLNEIVIEHLYEEQYVPYRFNSGFNFVAGNAEPVIDSNILLERFSNETNRLAGSDNEGYLSVLSTALDGEVIQGFNDTPENENLALAKIINYNVNESFEEGNSLQEEIQVVMSNQGCMLVDRTNQHLLDQSPGNLSRQDQNKTTAQDLYGKMNPRQFFKDFTSEKQKRKKIERDRDFELFNDLNIAMIFSRNNLSRVDFGEITRGMTASPPHLTNLNGILNFTNFASVVFRRRNLVRVEYLDRITDGGNTWTVLTREALTTLRSRKGMLCRLVSLPPVKNTDLPIYSEYFYVYKGTEESVTTLDTVLTPTPRGAEAVVAELPADAVVEEGALSGIAEELY